jgi:hypothetical protein
LGDDLKQNPIDIELPKGDAKTSIDAAYGVQTQGGEIFVPDLPDVNAILAVPADAPLQNAILSSIAFNIQTHPESVQAALTQGMTTLTQIEARIKADSGNVNHQGIDISASHDAYMDFASGKASMEVAAAAMARDIRAAFLAESLTPVEAGQLQGVMAEVVGDAELAAAYVGVSAASTGDGLITTMDGQAESGYNDSGNASKFDYNKYLRKKRGNPPANMLDPHAHHILFKEGIGDAQKALVKEGQALLRRYGIDPIRGLENLVWAPNRIAGQHDLAALKNVVGQLKAVEKFGGTPEFIRKRLIRQLGLLGEQAASRR